LRALLAPCFEEFMEKYGMPDRINEEVFISMAKAGL
jgi:hypothetical protein